MASQHRGQAAVFLLYLSADFLIIEKSAVLGFGVNGKRKEGVW
jgi:hypothetical protein